MLQFRETFLEPSRPPFYCRAPVSTKSTLRLLSRFTQSRTVSLAASRQPARNRCGGRRSSSPSALFQVITLLVVPTTIVAGVVPLAPGYCGSQERGASVGSAWPSTSPRHSHHSNA